LSLFKKYWRTILGTATAIPAVWHGFVWLFDWGARIDLVATKLHEHGGLSAMLEFLISPPAWFVFVAIPIAASLIWWDIIRRQPHVPEPAGISGALTDIALPKTQTIRHAFSKTQSIKALPPFLGGNMNLKLDNVAILRLHVPYSMEMATLMLDVVPMDMAVRTSPPWIEVQGVQGYSDSGSTQYVFDVGQRKRQEITVVGRTFVVTLLEVKKLSMANVANPIEYVFGISEK
jgi:hypothetical protein